MLINKNRGLRQACRLYDLVVFDSTHTRHFGETITGISHDRSMQDSFAAHGSVEGYELSLLRRAFQIRSLTGTNHILEWLVVRVALPQISLPRFFIANGNHDVELIRQLSIKYGNLVTDRNNYLKNLRPLNLPEIFCQGHTAYQIDQLLDDRTLSIVAVKYPSLSFEVEPENVYGYLDRLPFTSEAIEKSIYAVLWLAKHLSMAQDAQQTVPLHANTKTLPA